jgi:hypothetical protein
VSQASDLAVPNRLLAAGLWWFPPPRHAGEHGIGERRTSHLTVGVPAAQQQRAEPVGLGGGDHGELVAGAERDPQRLAVAVGSGYQKPVGI